MRSFLLEDKKAQWESYVNPKNHGLYPVLRELALQSKDNQQTQSI